MITYFIFKKIYRLIQLVFWFVLSLLLIGFTQSYFGIKAIETPYEQLNYLLEFPRYLWHAFYQFITEVLP